MITVKNDTGCVFGTQVLTEDGADICQSMAINNITLRLDVSDGVCRGEIEVGIVKSEVACGSVAWLTTNPLTGGFAPLSALIFEDGSRITLHSDGRVLHYPDGEAVSAIGISDGKTIKFPAAPAAAAPTNPDRNP